MNFGNEFGLESFIKESNKSGSMTLPKDFDVENGKNINEMIIKKLRLKSSKSNLKDYKKIRKIDQKQSHDYKHDFYFDKDSNTNYEAIIYGDLIPNESGKFKNREYKVINHHNIVKGIFEEESNNPILKLHKDDMFLVFNLNPKDEIEWDNINDLQNRLFRMVKFNENGEIILARHNYASGNVDKAPAITTENDLSDSSQVVLRRGPSTLRVVPAKLDPLGKLDIDFSRDFINSKSNR